MRSVTEAESGSPGAWSALPFAGLVLLVLWLPIPYGSNVRWAMALLGTLTYLLLAFWAVLMALGRVRIPSALWANRWMLLLWALWLGWICWQLVPQGPGSNARPISIQPAATYQRLVLSLSYLALYLLVLLAASSRDRLRLLATAIVISGLLQAVYGSLMVFSGIEYAFLEKKSVSSVGLATGTFINRNHLAGYLEISGAMAVGLLVSELRSGSAASWRVWLRDLVELAFSRKMRIRVFFAVMVVALVLTRSRMGNIAFFTSLLFCGSLYVLLRERRLFLKTVLLFASFLAVDLMIFSEWFGLEKLVQRVEQTNVIAERRAHVLPELLKGIDAYSPTGSGLGTFALAILPYRSVAPKQFLDHAHNDYAQFLIEVGFPGSFILGCMVLVTALHALLVIVRRRNRFRTGLGLAALIAMGAVAIHSAFDFNLQIPANAATLVIVMAMVNACSDSSRRDRNSGEEQTTANGGY